MAPPKRFRIQAKNYLLTYPKCSLSKQEALDQIQNLQTPTNKKYIKVCRELHQNGEPHLHALVQFEGKFVCTNSLFFDLQHPNSSIQFHCNIQGAKSSSDVKSYVDKDGDTVEWGEFQIDARSARVGEQTKNEAYAKALNTGNLQQALDVLRELAPRDFVLQYHNIYSNLEKIFAPPVIPFTPPFSESSFTEVPEDLEESNMGQRL